MIILIWVIVDLYWFLLGKIFIYKLIHHLFKIDELFITFYIIFAPVFEVYCKVQEIDSIKHPVTLWHESLDNWSSVAFPSSSRKSHIKRSKNNKNAIWFNNFFKTILNSNNYLFQTILDRIQEWQWILFNSHLFYCNDFYSQSTMYYKRQKIYNNCNFMYFSIYNNTVIKVNLQCELSQTTATETIIFSPKR